MSILDKLSCEDTCRRRETDFDQSPTLTLNCEQVNPRAVGNIATQFEFDLTGTLRVRFAANKAQYHGALRNAEKLLLIRLYGNILPLLYEAKRAAFGGSAKEVVEAISAIEREIGF